jgi:hypothetical protein
MRGGGGELDRGVVDQCQADECRLAGVHSGSQLAEGSQRGGGEGGKERG